MSSGVPSRPSGARATIWSMLAMTPDSIGRRIIGVSIAPGGMVFTVMPWDAKIERERLGQRDDPALRGDVVGHPFRARLRGGRRDRDDAAPPGRHHVGYGRLHAVKGTRQVDGEMRSQAATSMSRNFTKPSMPGAGDQDPDGAERAAGPVHRGVDGGPVAHVDGDGEARVHRRPRSPWPPARWRRRRCRGRPPRDPGPPGAGRWPRPCPNRHR